MFTNSRDVFHSFAAMTDEEKGEENPNIAFIVEGVVLLIISIIGIFGNVSAIVVFSK